MLDKNTMSCLPQKKTKLRPNVSLQIFNIKPENQKFFLTLYAQFTKNLVFNLGKKNFVMVSKPIFHIQSFIPV